MVRKQTIFAIAAVTIFLSTRALADEIRSGIDEQESVSITVYNSNLALVKDVRNMRLPRGEHNLWFQGVAAKIDPTSVHIRSLTSPDALKVLEQNFEYDLISPERIMQKYVGKTLELVRYDRDGNETRIAAKLLGVTSGYVYEIDGKIAINPHGRVELPALPEGLISTPSLVWALESAREKQRVEASYLTTGIGWKANYVAVVDKDDTHADISGWVTIDNRSGATYRNAALKLVAGDVNRVQDQRGRQIRPRAMMAVAETGAAQFVEESFFEYHLYTLDRKTTVRDNQTKQLALLSAEDVGVVKTFVYSPTRDYFFARFNGTDKSTKVGVYLSLENSTSNGMGMPLPKGVVRVYKKDSDDALQFVGEDRIDHTPKDETIRIRMGNAFDVVAERVQTDYEVLSSGHLYRTSHEITIRNHKDESITVQVVELMRGDWEVRRASHKFVKESSHRIRFDVSVEARGEAKVRYTVLIRH